ncbi:MULTISPECIES: hypothetical protein [unclassified Bradyrhizobium]|uniref:hypothetical protein n=1 Tax=unclassified Bradyrhizobium TaxID=2631580 RepID=UPI002916B9CB|nr:MULTISPECIES: hypothetical protein [unclassified Bradyrhizobium]
MQIANLATILLASSLGGHRAKCKHRGAEVLGWKFRIKTLEKDLTEVPRSGIATIMSDEFFNVYDKTGRGMSDDKP